MGATEVTLATTMSAVPQAQGGIQILGTPFVPLLFALRGIPERELDRLKQKAESLGKSSFAFAVCMDPQNEGRERGASVGATEEFFPETLERHHHRPSVAQGSR